MTDAGDRLLWLAIEDHSGLWEAIWDLRGLHPDSDVKILIRTARTELLRLSDQGFIRFYRSVEPEGVLMDVDRPKVIAVLEEDQNWNEPAVGSVVIRFGATPAGYAAAGIPSASRIEFPDMRLNVIASLESLADLDYQRAHWLNPKVFDNLDLTVHLLYDDFEILPDPESRVGTVLRPAEVEPLRVLDSRLGRLIDELGDVDDEVYLDDPGWPAVVAAAQRALAVFETGVMPRVE